MLELSRHDDVTRIELSTPVSRAFGYRVSVFVVRDVLIDTGFPRVAQPLIAALAPLRPRGAIVTHYHEDHAGNVDALARLGMPLGMAPATRELVRKPKPIGLYRRVCWGVAAPLTREPVPFDDPGLRLLPAPGHTVDHHVVWDLERETMFGGDLFIGVKVRIAHPNEDLRQQARTLRAMAALRPKRFFDAHRGLLPDAIGLLTAKADWIERVIGSVEGLARQGWPDTTIAAEVLGRGDFTGWFSRGDYSKLNLVRSIRASMA